MSEVVVFGATGFTGKLTVSALIEMGIRPVIGGRSEAKLQALSEAHGGLETRVADATDASTLPALVKGAKVVVDTAGPFVQFGEPVVSAAIGAGAHFLDTTGEQGYMARIQAFYHGAARTKKLAVVNGQAFEFALGYCAAALLAESDPTLDTIDVFNRAESFTATRGTLKSGIAAVAQDCVCRRHGRLQPLGYSPIPKRIKNPVTGRTELAIPFPGGEALHLNRGYPHIQNTTTNLVQPAPLALAAMGGWSLRGGVKKLYEAGRLAPLIKRIDAGSEGPTPDQRKRQPFLVTARGSGPHSRGGTVFVQGNDPYGITAVIAALGAKLLLEDGPKETGVISTDQAFGARKFLDALAPYDVTYAAR